MALILWVDYIYQDVQMRITTYSRNYSGQYRNQQRDAAPGSRHSATVAGLATTLGSGAMTNSISEVVDNDVIFVIGTNTTENHPVIGTQIKRAKAKGAKLIVAEPRRIELAEEADVFLQIKPGSNIALLNGMLNYIIENDLHDKEYIAERTENLRSLRNL